MQKRSALEGVWRTVGYNKLFVFNSEDFRIYDLSAISCVEAHRGSRVDFNKYFDRVEVEAVDRISVYARGGITKYTLIKQDHMPTHCQLPGEPGSQNPELNFEVFWRYFQENYAFFKLRKINWDSAYRTFHSRVNSQTSDLELLDVFTQILRSFNDSHVGLTAGGQEILIRKPHALVQQWQKDFNSDGFLELYPLGVKKLQEVVTQDFLHGEYRTAANNHIVWGKVAPNIGYVAIFAMMDLYAGFDLLHYAGFEVVNNKYLKAVDLAMDQLMEDFHSLDALIVDVRFNLGGHDAVGFSIASRFTDRRQMVFRKKAVDEDSYSQPQVLYIKPKGAYQFTGPTYLLTSEATASAAEIFTLCMMALPYVTRVGGTTRGVFSDTLLKTLPNGWIVSISNEIYEAADGVCYEGIGVPPQIEAPVFAQDNFYGNLRLTLDRTLEYIKAKTDLRGLHECL